MSKNNAIYFFVNILGIFFFLGTLYHLCAVCMELLFLSCSTLNSSRGIGFYATQLSVTFMLLSPVVRLRMSQRNLWQLDSFLVMVMEYETDLKQLSLIFSALRTLRTSAMDLVLDLWIMPYLAGSGYVF